MVSSSQANVTSPQGQPAADHRDCGHEAVLPEAGLLPLPPEQGGGHRQEVSSPIQSTQYTVTPSLPHQNIGSQCGGGRGEKLDYGDTREMLHLTSHNLLQTNMLLSTVLESSEPLAHCHQINVKCECHTL